MSPQYYILLFLYQTQKEAGPEATETAHAAFDRSLAQHILQENRALLAVRSDKIIIEKLEELYVYIVNNYIQSVKNAIFQEYAKWYKKNNATAIDLFHGLIVIPSLMERLTWLRVSLADDYLKKVLNDDKKNAYMLFMADTLVRRGEGDTINIIANEINFKFLGFEKNVYINIAFLICIIKMFYNKPNGKLCYGRLSDLVYILNANKNNMSIHIFEECQKFIEILHSHIQLTIKVSRFSCQDFGWGYDAYIIINNTSLPDLIDNHSKLLNNYLGPEANWLKKEFNAIVNI